MTSSIPVAHNAPVTPPPENMAFPNMPRMSEHEEPFSMKAFQNPAFQNAQLKFHQAQAQAQIQAQAQAHDQTQKQTQPLVAPSFPLNTQRQQPHPPHSPAPSSSNAPAQPAAQPQAQQQQQQQQPRPQPQDPFNAATAAAAAASLDPKYLAMVSRIASYYQQRCQAVANYQQQRCQAWATMHRQKCQEMVQAAMLVVAWYIRDRIQRRRRKQKRSFRKGLTERTSRSKVTKGEVVRRWVLQVPEAAPSPEQAHHQRLVDREEAEFNMDREVTLDKDTKLFSVADNLIKSQLSKIEVPLMGALSFDESESENEEDEPAAEEEEEEQAEDEIDYEQADELYDDDDDDMSLDDYEEDELGSDLVQNGTGEGSRPKDGTSIS
ncbi:uncharacterized protein MKZ38_006435 [Zalerion maritima]|uniref:Uncharacterized protein n=1 Tax=Zalerion maritima TaxID=339359 RepID=A0AAD5S3F6_9PEZI|nr:uncharacterized protein MKZ38_006435 [Zalerion maritima]